MIGDWRAQGSKACVDVAHEIVVDVLKNHVVAPIDPAIDAKMQAIVKAADEDFLKSKE
jgi:trimethylamine--corrinoid protein Co-methyltransferase